MPSQDLDSAPESPGSDNAPSTNLHSGRRRLLRGGLITAPALLTLVNRPVMATELCRTPSAALSASLSRPNSGTFNCTGKGPASWVSTPADSWPTGTRTMAFKDAIGASDKLGTKTLPQIVSLSTDTGTRGLAKHLAAAYLNASNGLTPTVVLSVSTIKSIWASYIARGYYEPTAGIRWFPDYAEPTSPGGGLIAWLKTTMPY